MIKKFEQFDGNGPELHYYALDWDDNILHMPTKILMDKKVGEEWAPTEVSTAQFAEVRNDQENYRIRNNNPIEAFSEFRDTGIRGDNAFLEDVLFFNSNLYCSKSNFSCHFSFSASSVALPIATHRSWYSWLA